MRRVVLIVLALGAAQARAETWYVTRPVTGSACASFEWEAFDPSGFRYFHALTPDSTAGIPQGMWPGRARCRCWDAEQRTGPWSPISATYIPQSLARQWWTAGASVGVPGLSMTVALSRAVEASWPDSLR